MDVGNKIIENRMAKLPSVDYVLKHRTALVLQKEYGLSELTKVTRSILLEVRQSMINDQVALTCDDASIFGLIQQRLETRAEKKVKAVLNLTGTVLHTNLGRAVLPQEAVDALRVAASEACILEYDVGAGKRGDRDQLVEELLCELTGAEAATVVNNNAAEAAAKLAAEAAAKLAAEAAAKAALQQEVNAAIALAEAQYQNELKIAQDKLAATKAMWLAKLNG